MARIRTIKPEFHDDEKLATISRDARLVYIAIWNFSDDYGVVKGDNRWLKGRVLPYDDLTTTEFEEMIMELVNIKRLIPFSVKGEKFFFIPNFREHQKINKPSNTRNPEPPLDIIQEYYGSTTGVLPVGREIVSSNSNSNISSFSFEEIWKEYPFKVGKKGAKKHFDASVLSEEDFENIQIALVNYKTHLTANTWKAPQNASTWFNNWHDWIDFKELPKGKDNGQVIPTPVCTAEKPMPKGAEGWKHPDYKELVLGGNVTRWQCNHCGFGGIK